MFRAAVLLLLVLQSPQEFFGFRMGEDRQLAGWPEIQKYFQTIAAASDRVELVDAGPSTDGNRLIAAVISAPENIARLEEIRAANLRLADPRTHREADARALAATQPGRRRHRRQHSRHGDRRDAGRQRAAAHAGDDATTRRRSACCSNVVLILFPSLNPDGHLLTVDWYRKWKGTEFEGSADAVALSPLRRPRHQPRRVHDEHGREPHARAISSIAAGTRRCF